MQLRQQVSGQDPEGSKGSSPPRRFENTDEPELRKHDSCGISTPLTPLHRSALSLAITSVLDQRDWVTAEEEVRDRQRINHSSGGSRSRHDLAPKLHHKMAEYVFAHQDVGILLRPLCTPVHIALACLLDNI